MVTHTAESKRSNWNLIGLLKQVAKMFNTISYLYNFLKAIPFYHPKINHKNLFFTPLVQNKYFQGLLSCFFGKGRDVLVLKLNKFENAYI